MDYDNEDVIKIEKVKREGHFFVSAQVTGGLTGQFVIRSIKTFNFPLLIRY